MTDFSSPVKISHSENINRETMIAEIFYGIHWIEKGFTQEGQSS